MAQIELDGICKSYFVAKRDGGRFGTLKSAFKRDKTEIKALTDVSLKIESGERVGYIGPNGAGKSTTIKIMAGILVPDSGMALVDGRVPWRERREHTRHIGVVFGQRSQLWWDTPVADSFELLRDIYSVSRADYISRLKKLTELMDAGDLLATPVRQLSLGQRMRCELIAALLHAPEILFLDEPTIGLDAVTKLALRDMLKELNAEGVTMLLTTHDMDDIEALCPRVIALGNGRKLFDGGMDDLRERFAPVRVLKARLRSDSLKPDIPTAESVKLDGRELEVRFRPKSVSVQQIISAIAEQCELADLTVEAEDVERMVAEMYREFHLCAR